MQNGFENRKDSRIIVRFRSTLDEMQFDIDFQSEVGIIVLFGPSGCGKTTTLNCVSGLTNPQSGLIKVDGTTFFDSANGINLPTRKRSVGYVFQNAALFPHLTVEGNIVFGIDRRPGHERRARLEYLLDVLSLGGLKERRPSQLSGGQAQRVALARALAPQPKLLLLDEPFSALDVEWRELLAAELKLLHDLTGIPMIFVTHSPEEAYNLGDLIVHLEQGRVKRTVEAKS